MCAQDSLPSTSCGASVAIAATVAEQKHITILMVAMHGSPNQKTAHSVNKPYILDYVVASE